LKRKAEDADTAFWLAMCHWQLLHEDDARAWFDKGVKWSEAEKDSLSPSGKEDLRRVRAEAAELLEIEDDVPSGDKR
jgi:hypothetical protein